MLDDQICLKREPSPFQNYSEGEKNSEFESSAPISPSPGKFKCTNDKKQQKV